VIKLDLPDGFSQLIDTMRQMDSLFVREHTSTHFLELILNESKTEATLQGNVAGLIRFCLEILEVTGKATDGAHRHLDSHGVMDRCDLLLVIRLIPASWDE
jgi:hypothetical protein